MAASLGAMDEGQFCDAFFHVKPTPEAGVSATCCLRAPAGCCSGKTTALVAHLVDARGALAYGEVYVNVSQRDHAEDLLMRDARLLAAAEAAGVDTTCLLYTSPSPRD